MRGLTGLLVRRFVRREQPAPRAVAVAVVAGLGLLAGVGATWAGRGGFFGPLSVWASGLLLLACVGVRALTPSLAVAVLSVALGVSSLAVSLGVASGFERELTGRLARLGGHVVVGKYGLDFAEHDALTARLAADPRVEGAGAFCGGTAAIAAPAPRRIESPQPEATLALVKGIDPHRAAASLRDDLRGGEPTEVLRPADPGRLPGAALGVRLAARLGVAIGDDIVLVSPEALTGDVAEAGRPRRATLRVLGLVDTGLSELDDELVLVHLTAAQALLFGRDRVSGIELRLFDPWRASTLAGELEASLNDGLPAPLYRATSWDRPGSALTTVVRQARAAIAVLVGLMVLVAGGSLVAALWLLVRRKRRHLAVLSALGAAPGRLFWVLEATGLGAGACGAAAGLALGGITLAALAALRLPLDPTIYPVDHLPVAFRPSDALLPAGLALAVCGLVSGPLALLASRARPLLALRG